MQLRKALEKRKFQNGLTCSTFLLPYQQEIGQVMSPLSPILRPLNENRVAIFVKLEVGFSPGTTAEGQTEASAVIISHIKLSVRFLV